MWILLAILALFTPRLVVLLLWIFTDWFSGVFATTLWPILGFIFLPTTLIWYSAVLNWYEGVWAFVPILGTVVALLIDLSIVGGRRWL
jgi:hypothetical protein